MVVAHLSVSALPADGASVGRYVRRAIGVLKASKLKHEVHAMGTDIECGTLDELFAVVKSIDAALAKMGATRIMTQLKIDHRTDAPSTLASKVASATRPPRRTP